MSNLTKAYLIFFTVFLSFILLAIPVYSEASEQQPLEQQDHEIVQEVEQIQEEIQEDTQEDEQEKPTQVVSTEDGVYNLVILKNANMRSEPTVDSKSIIVIPFGVDLVSGHKIVNTNGEIWYAISYGDRSGYISADVVEDKTAYINEADEEAVVGNSIETSVQEKPKETVAANAIAGSSSESQTTEQETETKTSEIKTVVDKPVTRNVDSILFVFLLTVIFGVVISLIVFGSLRHEYARYRKQILKRRKDKVILD